MGGYRLVTGFLAWVLLPGLAWTDFAVVEGVSVTFAKVMCPEDSNS